MISTRKHSPKNNVSWWLSILRVLTIRILLNFLHLHTWLPKLHKRSSWCKCEKNLLLFLLIKNRIQGCAFLSCLFNKKKFTRTENAGQWYCFLSTVTVSWLPDVECVLGEGQYRRHCRGQQTHTLACLKKTSCGVFFFFLLFCLSLVSTLFLFPPLLQSSSGYTKNAMKSRDRLFGRFRDILVCYTQIQQ